MRLESKIQPIPMEVIRTSLQNPGLSDIEKDIQRINNYIQNSLDNYKREIVYQFNRLLTDEESELLFRLFRDREKYNIQIDLQYTEATRIFVSW